MKASSPLWAITSYFNPGGYSRRKTNYTHFRRHLSVPLVTVELTFGDAAPALADGDADIVVHCTDGDVMWQKERLLNVALERLPPECRYVAWIDCDLVFGDAGWAERTCDALQHNVMVQPFERLHHAPRDADPDALDPQATGGWMQDSLARALETSGQPVQDLLRYSLERRAGRPVIGMAWAARRELLASHGLYDRCIVGGGDTALVCAAMGHPEVVIGLHRMNAAQQAAYLQWALPFHADVKGRVADVPGLVHHLWHGDMVDRQTPQRHQRLGPHGFEPARDLRHGRNGAWKWASDKPSLATYVRDYFASRHEDGRPEASEP